MRTGRIFHPAFDHTAAAASPAAAFVHASRQENHTMDLAVLAITALFFALAFAYVALCDKL